jgi:superfamily II DNA or RNA helicase
LDFNMGNFYEDTDRALSVIQQESNGVFDAATGTGKGVIIARDVSYVLNERPVPQVIIIAGHRILLTAQLMERVIQESLKEYKSVPFKRIGVNSGEGESIETETLEDKIALSQYPDTMCRGTDDLQESLKEAIDRGVNVGLYVTYHSLWKVVLACVKLGIRPRFYADEIHSPAGDKDKWEAVEQMVAQSDECYAFSATIDKYKKKIHSVFGDTIFHLPASEAIRKGLICKPVWMVADVEGKREKNLAQGVVQAFREHDDRNSFDVKALVNCKDTSDIKSIQGSKQLKELQKDYPSLMVAIISSQTGCIIDGKKVKRPEWIKQVNGHDGYLLVLHIEICNAGIDVPEFNLPVWTYLPQSETYLVQGNGRGARLSRADRPKLEGGEISTNDRTQWNKPFNTVCLLAWEDSLEEDKEDFVAFILRSREQGFECGDIIYTSKNSGKKKDPFDPPLPPGGIPQSIESLVEVALENERLLELKVETAKMNPMDAILAIF